MLKQVLKEQFIQLYFVVLVFVNEMVMKFGDKISKMFLVIFGIMLVFVLFLFVRFEFEYNNLKVFDKSIQQIEVDFKVNIERIVEEKLQIYEIVFIISSKKRFDVIFGKLLFISGNVM